MADIKYETVFVTDRQVREHCVTYKFNGHRVVLPKGYVKSELYTTDGDKWEVSIPKDIAAAWRLCY